MRPILLTGGSGQIGRAIRLRAGPTIAIVAPGRAELDLGDAASIAAMVAARPWAAVVNCAAYTAVDAAETQAAAAWTVNALGPARLAAATRAAGVPLLHLSTDHVFDGAKPLPYETDDALGPINVYGASKAAGEVAVGLGNPDHVILRTAWVVSPFGRNFARTMLRLAAESAELRVVADQRGNPTAAGDVADTVLDLVARMTDGGPQPRGIFHFTNEGEASWAELAEAILRRAAIHGHPRPAVRPIASVDFPTAARRPADSRLSGKRLRDELGRTARDWRIAIDEVVDALMSGPRPRLLAGPRHGS